MSITTENDNKSDPIQELSIQIPCRLAKRVETYANDTGSSIEGVVIEALDVFLRDRGIRR